MANSKSLAQLLEERRDKQGGDSRIDQLNAESKETQNKLETLRKMIVGADVIDEAGNGIDKLIAGIAKDHADMVVNANKTIASISADKSLAVEAVESLTRDKDQALKDLKQSQEDMKTATTKHVSDAVTSMAAEARGNNDREVLKLLGEFNSKLSQFDSMQNNILSLNETMQAVLGVLQSPKVIEFDNDGMPIGVRTR